MSGGYTHITLAQLAIEEARNRRPGLLHHDGKQALGYWKKFCIVGAVAPDYPYLDVLDSNSSAWADAMHKGHAVALLRNGAAGIRDISDNNVRQKCMAWLFGFAAHVATDGTIHPVVNLKVGPYEQNKTRHRRCEMSQDVYAHGRLNMGALEFNRQISTNVNDTSDANNSDRMDPDVAQLWQDLLTGVYSKLDPQLRSPKVHDWHSAMRRMMRLGESGNVLFPFARHVAAGQGLVYPAAPETEYIKGLEVPGGGAMDFEEIFQKALNNILELWGWLALSLQNLESPLDTLTSWSLDTGIDENNHMIYWN
ncbi:MAG: zinc dependent phospholipase C family protein [Methylobacter sp.]|nr:zinc dependent phospholipase C family protein [Methylobacter sp.]